MKEITIYDLARESGYSISTVSKAMSGNKVICEETRSRIAEFAEKLGYRPHGTAQALSRGRKTVAVILPERPAELLSLFSDGVRAAAEKYESQNVGFRIYRFGYSAEGALLGDIVAEALECDAFIVMPMNDIEKGIGYLGEMVAKGPTVTISFCPDNDFGAVAISPDAHAAGELAGDIVACVVGNGGEAGVICGMSNLRVHNSNVEGFRKSAQRTGFKVADVFYSDDSHINIYKNTKDLIKKHPKIRAVFVTTALASAACDALNDCGKKEISVIAVDTTDENLRSLREGKIAALISQNQSGQITAAADIAVRRLLKLRGPSAAAVTSVKPEAVFASQAKAYLNEERNDCNEKSN